jgi:uncharacterized membrane protein (UPF0182 family)
MNINKYKIAGIVNIIFSLFPIPVIFILDTMISRANKMYKDLGMTPGPNYTPAFVAFFILIVISIFNIVTGIKCFKESPEKDKNFERGVNFAIFTLIFDVILIIIIASSTIAPIYQVAGQI